VETGASASGFFSAFDPLPGPSAGFFAGAREPRLLAGLSAGASTDPSTASEPWVSGFFRPRPLPPRRRRRRADEVDPSGASVPSPVWGDSPASSSVAFGTSGSVGLFGSRVAVERPRPPRLRVLGLVVVPAPGGPTATSVVPGTRSTSPGWASRSTSGCSSTAFEPEAGRPAPDEPPPRPPRPRPPRRRRRRAPLRGGPASEVVGSSMGSFRSVADGRSGDGFSVGATVVSSGIVAPFAWGRGAAPASGTGDLGVRVRGPRAGARRGAFGSVSSWVRTSSGTRSPGSCGACSRTRKSLSSAERPGRGSPGVIPGPAGPVPPPRSSPGCSRPRWPRTGGQT
jgi:hypothetical protein